MYKKTFKDFVAKCEQEEVDKAAIITFIEKNDDALLRTNLIAHITSSAIIINEAMDKVLFAHHNIYNSWAWVGGHNDGNPNLLEVAIKEAKEETGIKNVQPYNDELISLDVILVENHFKRGKFVGDHLHLNATYLLVASETEKLTIKADENSGVKWFKISEVLNYVNEERIKAVYQKIFERIIQIKNDLN